LAELPGAASADATQSAAAPPSGQAEAAAPAPAPPSEPAVTAGATGGAPSAQAAPLVVVLTFSGQCWLSLTVDGTRAPSRTAMSGERLEFAVQRSITMTVGNAGAVAVTLNGKPASALGDAGKVVTTTITASGYETFLR